MKEHERNNKFIPYFFDFIHKKCRLYQYASLVATLNKEEHYFIFWVLLHKMN